MGTRPEAIKMAPLILLCRQERNFEVKLCITAQHRSMLDQVLDFFEIRPDYDLSVMQPGQSLFTLTASCLNGLAPVLEEENPDLVLVQGDTTTAFAGALAAYYKNIKIAHIEAGLRSGNKLSPFPEEANRRMIGTLADFHFAPTPQACNHLYEENIRQNVFQVGNTVIDALLMGLDKIKNDQRYTNQFSYLDHAGRIVLITGHRRESFGKPFEDFCSAISDLALRYPDVHFVYPVHLNPQVQAPVKKILGHQENIHLIAPVSYPEMIWLMQRSYFVITDSGGVQEEAPSLGKPVLVTREVTERTEGIEAGTALLVGTNPDRIKERAVALLEDQTTYHQMANAVNPYGDGTTCRQVIDILKKNL